MFATLSVIYLIGKSTTELNLVISVQIPSRECFYVTEINGDFGPGTTEIS